MSFLVLSACSGEASWTLADAPAGGPEGGAGGGAAASTRLSTFQGLSDGLPADAAPQALAQLDGKLYLSTAAGVFSLPSTGRTWAAEALPLRSGEQVTSLARVDLSICVTTTQGLWVRAYTDEAFTLVASAPAGAFGLAKKAGELFLATSSGLHVSTDKGATWKRRFSGAPFTTTSGQFVAAAAQARLFVVDAAGKVWSSDDDGATWETGVITGTVKTLSAGGPVVLAMTATQTLRSDNYGNTFHPVSTDWSPLAVAVTPSWAFAGTMNGVRVSDDGGATWRDGSAGLPASSEVRALFTAGNALLAHAKGTIYLASVE